VRRVTVTAAVFLLAGVVVNVAVAAARDGTELASVVSFLVWRVTVAAARSLSLPPLGTADECVSVRHNIECSLGSSHACSAPQAS